MNLQRPFSNGELFSHNLGMSFRIRVSFFSAILQFNSSIEFFSAILQHSEKMPSRWACYNEPHIKSKSSSEIQSIRTPISQLNSIKITQLGIAIQAQRPNRAFSGSDASSFAPESVFLPLQAIVEFTRPLLPTESIQKPSCFHRRISIKFILFSLPLPSLIANPVPTVRCVLIN